MAVRTLGFDSLIIIYIYYFTGISNDFLKLKFHELEEMLSIRVFS